MAQNITKLLIYIYIKRVLTYTNSSQKTFLGGVLALAKLVQMVDLRYGRAPYGYDVPERTPASLVARTHVQARPCSLSRSGDHSSDSLDR